MDKAYRLTPFFGSINRFVSKAKCLDATG